ncbi:MAG: hypothetical protein KBD76_09140 [Bacteriovorax sp.]|jgi:hypothetical protein|nr:hypothetical protein [Bacteriovorax sp.]
MAQRICPLFLSFLVGITALLPFSAWTEDYKRTVITDPGLSRRCELLSEKRLEKINNKQRILALIARNKHLQNITPENKVTVKKRLEANLGHLEHELLLTQTQIQYQEESIVRKGCPGIAL